jgi:DNA (cytosine-5)-methyltransferase 1
MGEQITLEDCLARASRPRTVVSFAGIGGTCVGLARAGLAPQHAINHSPIALAIHAANHPWCHHHIEDVYKVEPIRGTDFFWLSPDCTHHSKAKGGKPKSGKSRALANVAPWWGERAAPAVIGLENVEEFADWGPLDAEGYPIKCRKGELFKRWVKRLERAGYRVEWNVLRACDFGAPTVRKRLYLVARRDGLRTEWPRATHGPGLLPYRSARECIDWSIPIPSIFDRAKPHVEATHRRIAAGLEKFGAAHLIQRGQGERIGQAPRCMSLDRPLNTVMAEGVKHGIVVAWVAKHFGGKSSPGSSLDAPLGTVTTRDHNALVVGRKDTSSERRAQTRAWLDRYVGPGRFTEIEDIGMRNLAPRELARAMGFPDSYVLDPVVNGKRIGGTAQVRGIGNGCCPDVIEALARSWVPNLVERKAA